MYLVETKAGHPVLKAWKYPLPGDDAVAMLHRVVIDTDSGAVVRFKMAPDFHRAMLGDDVSVRDWIWSPDASRLAFVSTSRDHKTGHGARGRCGLGRRAHGVRGVGGHAVRIAGRLARAVGHERDPLELGARRLEPSLSLRPDHRAAQAPDHLGPRAGDGRSCAWTRRRARCTSRPTAASRGRIPYFAHLYRIGLDGKGYTSLTPDDGHHGVQMSTVGRGS